MMHVKWLNYSCCSQNKYHYHWYLQKLHQWTTRIKASTEIGILDCVAFYTFTAHVCLLYKHQITFFKFTKSESFLDKFLKSQNLLRVPSQLRYQKNKRIKPIFEKLDLNPHYKMFFEIMPKTDMRRKRF